MEDKEILSIHAKNQGVLNIAPQLEVKNRKELGEAYTPGVAIISKLIERYPELKETLAQPVVFQLLRGKHYFIRIWLMLMHYL